MKTTCLLLFENLYLINVFGYTYLIVAMAMLSLPTRPVSKCRAQQQPFRQMKNSLVDLTDFQCCDIAMNLIFCRKLHGKFGLKIKQKPAACMSLALRDHS